MLYHYSVECLELQLERRLIRRDYIDRNGISLKTKDFHSYWVFWHYTTMLDISNAFFKEPTGNSNLIKIQRAISQILEKIIMNHATILEDHESKQVSN